MMHYASQGVRNTARKGSNVLVHHGGHNGPGGSTTANTTSRSLHISNNFLAAARVAHPPVPLINSLEAIRPRNPSHRLFSASRNFLQRIFTHLSTPGLRAPSHLAQVQHASTRSLLSASTRATSIQGGLSAAARSSIRNNALQRQANLFLPRAPTPAPPRFGGVAQVGLGAARNFSTGRPIFQQLAENVPIAGRALYQVDWDLETQKEQVKMRAIIRSRSKGVPKSKEMLKPSSPEVIESSKPQSTTKETTQVVEQTTVEQEFDHYFSQDQRALVTTYLLVPLAPTPSARMPLQLDPDVSTRDPSLLPPLSYLGAMHADHSTHALRVSTLFTRLDQANVWEQGGVTCTAYSQGIDHQSTKNADGTLDVEGACTVLQVEFVGWTKAAVRGILGESGSGWCVLEEVEDDNLTNMDSLTSEIMEDHSLGYRTPDIREMYDLGTLNLHDPENSFVLPTLDFSSSFTTSIPDSSTPTSEGAFANIPSGMELDPWTEVYPLSPSGSSESLLSDYSDLIIEPPSTNGYFGQRHGLGLGIGFSAVIADRFEEPRESIFL